MVNRIEAITNQIDKVIEKKISGSENKKIKKMLKQCFLNTLETTVKWKNNEAFVITGDIPAMWLRDSSVQVKHYIPYVNEVEGLGAVIESLIKRQIGFIIHDPYANAFNSEANWHGHKDETDLSPIVWERKYEIDSLCYPIWLSYSYYKSTGRTNIFNKNFLLAMKTIIATFKIEQNHVKDSTYTFKRYNCPDSDTLSNNGKGSKVGYTGMTWSGFRPSDDSCKYGYLVPANMMASVILGYIEEFSIQFYNDKNLAEEASVLQKEIDQGINDYGIYNHPKFGNIYAYETDGLGNYNLMDDANVPSLLSIPYIGYLDTTDPVYQNTRRFILSKENPYYYKGTHAKGIGSPHTPPDYIWPISLAIQGLTSNNIEEQKEIFNTLISTDGNTGFMHEGFNVNNPEEFTRSWFAWANSIFSEFVIFYMNFHN